MLNRVPDGLECCFDLRQQQAIASHAHQKMTLEALARTCFSTMTNIPGHILKTICKAIKDDRS